jgi:hypothetical protein
MIASFRLWRAIKKHLPDTEVAQWLRTQLDARPVRKPLAKAEEFERG